MSVSGGAEKERYSEERVIDLPEKSQKVPSCPLNKQSVQAVRSPLHRTPKDLYWLSRGGYRLLKNLTIHRRPSLGGERRRNSAGG